MLTDGGLNPNSPFALTQNAVATLAQQGRFKGLTVAGDDKIVVVSGAVDTYHARQAVLHTLSELGRLPDVARQGAIIRNAVFVRTPEEIARREAEALQDRGPAANCLVSATRRAANPEVDRASSVPQFDEKAAA